MASLNLTEFVGVLATVITIGQFLAGSLIARKVMRMGTPGDLSPVPYIAGCLGCTLWFLYGVILKDATIMYTNVAGITLNCLYVCIFYLYTGNKTLIGRQILGVLVGIVTIVIYIRSFEGDESGARNSLGLICTVISLIACASPLTVLNQVIRTKSTETLPFPVIISVFFVCLLWFIYGYLISDFYMIVTNGIGGLISTVQLSLFLIYPSSSSQYKGTDRLFDNNRLI